MTAHVESQKQKVHKEILFRASKNPLKIPLREEAATRRPLRGGVHTDVLDASLPSPPARFELDSPALHACERKGAKG